MFKLIKICIAVFIIISVSTIISLSIYKSVPTVNSNEGTELPIIMYHSILKNSDLAGKYIITPSQLVNDIEYLEENGYTTISAKELIDFIDNGTDLPEKPVMLTFDDGCYNNYEYALPILEKHSEHGIFCIVGQYTDDYTETNEANTNYGYMRWIDVFNLSTSKYAEIANHSYNFHQYNQGRAGSKKKAYESAAEYKNIFKNDTEKLQNECISHLKFAPVIYAYPFGAYSSESADVLKDMGFRISLTCNEGVNIITHNPDCTFFLKRNNRPSDVGTAEFFKNIINK